MCNHKNIVVSHYTLHFEGEIGDRIACEVRCKDCDSVIYKYNKTDDKEGYSYSKYVQEAYNYINRNKDRIETLVDLTCNNLNDKYKIKDGLKEISL